jgi:Zn-finger nucleic acid-binding protein
MDCPVCKNVKLVMSDRQGIEIDYCPNCRGVWLDRGELDKIIDRSVGLGKPQQTEGFGHSQPSHGYPPQGYQKKKKREGFLGELFDFD